MTKKHTKKYLFFHYSDMPKGPFKELIKQYDKVFSFIDPTETVLPFDIVMLTHELKDTFEWVKVPSRDIRTSVSFLSFFIGRTHAISKKNVIFHVHSGLDEINTLVNYLQAEGRQCQFLWNELTDSMTNEIVHEMSEELTDRVEAGDFLETSWEPTAEELPYAFSEETLGINTANRMVPEPKSMLNAALVDDSIEDELEFSAVETVKLLLKSGNRPSKVAILKNYIKSNASKSIASEQTELVINRLRDRKSIEIQENGVIYNF